VRTGLLERIGGREADASRRAGDQRDATVKRGQPIQFPPCASLRNSSRD